MNEEKGGNIDIVGIILLLWSKRKRIIINCVIGGILSIIIAYSIPKEYTSEVVLAPELASSMSGLSGGLSSLASMAGVDLSLGGGEDALYPELYPQIVESTPFLCELMSLPVQGSYKKEPIETDLYHYLRSYQRTPWWEKILGAPGKMIQKLKSNPVDTIVPTSVLDSRHLTRRQQTIMKSLSKKISVDVDKGTSVISLGVTMQDPAIAADVAQAVSDNLQNYIVRYRSAKARKDLEYMELVYNDSKQKYYDAQSKYALYADQHQGLVRMQHQIELNRLENEQNLAYNIYDQISSQYEISKAKVQEQTPVCVVMQPPVVPFKASAPKKMMMGLLFVFLAFFGTSCWFIIKDRLLEGRDNGLRE